MKFDNFVRNCFFYEEFFQLVKRNNRKSRKYFGTLAKNEMNRRQFPSSTCTASGGCLVPGAFGGVVPGRAGTRLGSPRAAPVHPALRGLALRDWRPGSTCHGRGRRARSRSKSELEAVLPPLPERRQDLIGASASLAVWPAQLLLANGGAGSWRYPLRQGEQAY